MAEYIEREALLQAVLELPPKMDEQGYGWLGRRGVWQMVLDFPAADVRPVVVCADCKWWTKQEASLQGRCELLQMYPTGAWFCANGKREES